MPIIYPDNLIGYDTHRKFEYFSNPDTEDLFKQNLKSQPEDWIYRNKTIIYERNNSGHRCSLNKENLTNPYILFTGCSMTEGTGLQLEDTYSYIISKKLNLPYYNLAIAGSGWDLLVHNMIRWLELDIPKPSIVIIQWPAFYRYYIVNKQKYIQTILPNNNSLNEEYFLTDDFKLTNIGLYKNLIKKLEEHKIKYLNNTVTFGPQPISLINEFFNLKVLDRARDCSPDHETTKPKNLGHPGIQSNALWAYQLIGQIKSL